MVEDQKQDNFKSDKDELAVKVDIILNTSIESENEYNNLQGEGVKVIIPHNNFDFWTRLEVLLGLKLSGRFDTLTEASNLPDELWKRGETESEQ